MLFKRLNSHVIIKNNFLCLVIETFINLSDVDFDCLLGNLQHCLQIALTSQCYLVLIVKVGQLIFFWKLFENFSYIFFQGLIRSVALWMVDMDFFFVNYFQKHSPSTKIFIIIEFNLFHNLNSPIFAWGSEINKIRNFKKYSNFLTKLQPI